MARIFKTKRRLASKIFSARSSGRVSRRAGEKIGWSVVKWVGRIMCKKVSGLAAKKVNSWEMKRASG